MTARLDGRVAIVTGAAGGIGIATARRLRRDGALVIMADIDGPAVEAAAAGIDGAEHDRFDLTAEDYLSAYHGKVAAPALGEPHVA